MRLFMDINQILKLSKSGSSPVLKILLHIACSILPVTTMPCCLSSCQVLRQKVIRGDGISRTVLTCQTWGTGKIYISTKFLQEVGLPEGSLTGNFEEAVVNPSQLRWDPLPLLKGEQNVNFVYGLKTICGAGR